MFVIQMLLISLSYVIVYKVQISSINNISGNIFGFETGLNFNISSMVDMYQINTFVLFLKFLFVKSMLFMLVILCIWFFTNKILKAKCGFNNIANLCITILIPYTIISILSMVTGLIMPFMTISFGVVNEIIVIMLIYIGLKEVAQNNNDNNMFWKFICFVFAVSIVSNLILKVIFNIKISLL